MYKDYINDESRTRTELRDYAKRFIATPNDNNLPTKDFRAIFDYFQKEVKNVAATSK